MRRTRILLAEDHAIVAEGLKTLLSGSFDLVGKVGNGLAMIEAARQLDPDIIIADISMPMLSGLDATSQLKKEGSRSKIIILTMHPDLHLAKEALRLGASAYLLKQEAGEELFIAIEQVLEGKTYISPLIKKNLLKVMENVPGRKQFEGKLEEQIDSIIGKMTQRPGFELIKSRSVAMGETIRAAKKVAAGDVSPILITGETGTGKDLIAQAIHYSSHRASSNFVLINCPSVPETLFESELFGHEQGAFTDARKLRPGRLELAKGGTLFLDEISEIPLSLQSKLLRVIQEGTFQRVGGREDIELNAPIIAATNRNLRAEVVAGRFREDLYQRLFVVEINIPPLRERSDDILFLADHFLTVYNREYSKNILRISPEAADILMLYRWPGNVRELKHAIERAVFFEEGKEITPKHLRIDLNAVKTPAPVSETVESKSVAPSFSIHSRTPGGTLDQMSTTIIRKMVEQCGGNIARAARKLGISRSRIYRTLREVGSNSNIA